MIRKFKHNNGNICEIKAIDNNWFVIVSYPGYSCMNGTKMSFGVLVNWIEIFDDSPATATQMKPITCEHTFKSYTGLVEQFEYCSKCDMRKVC